MHIMTYLVTVVAFAVFGFIIVFFLSNWLFHDLTFDLLGGLLGAATGVMLALLTGPERMREWRV